MSGPNLKPGSLVFRRSDDSVVEVIRRDPMTGLLQLDDGTWVMPRALEDPLFEGRKRDIERAAERAAWREEFLRVTCGGQRRHRQRKTLSTLFWVGSMVAAAAAHHAIVCS